MVKKYLTDEERKAKKKEWQAKWLAKNPDYFREYRRMTRRANAKYQKEYLDIGDHREKHNEIVKKHQREIRMKKCKEQLEKENIV